MGWAAPISTTVIGLLILAVVLWDQLRAQWFGYLMVAAYTFVITDSWWRAYHPRFQRVDDADYVARLGDWLMRACFVITPLALAVALYFWVVR